MLAALFLRDIRLAWGKGGQASATLVFFALAMTCFTFGMGPEAAHQFAPATAWVAALLASLLGLPSLFEKDQEDGSLEQYLLFPVALEAAVLTKMAAYWVTHLLPLILSAPLYLLVEGQELGRVTALFASLMLGSLALLAISAFGAALTLGIRRSGAIQALIILPLYMPVLIFAVSAATGQGEGAWALLGGLSLVMLPLSCYACAWLVRAAQET